MNKPSSVIGLLRHGVTVANETGRIQGWSDSPLTAQGAERVRSWAPALALQGFSSICASDLGRAVHTAEIIAKELDLKIRTDPDLREQDWGSWNGFSLKAMRAKHPGELETQVRRGWDFRLGQGESRKETLQRVLPALSRHAAPGERILCITHQGVIKCIIYHLLGRRYLPEEPTILRGRNKLHLVGLTPEPSVVELNIAL
jgi:probable phosphoglycerate mutase